MFLWQCTLGQTTSYLLLPDNRSYSGRILHRCSPVPVQTASVFGLAMTTSRPSRACKALFYPHTNSFHYILSLANKMSVNAAFRGIVIIIPAVCTCCVQTWHT